MAGYNLILCPIDPAIEIDLEQVTEYLQKIEFLGVPCHASWDETQKYENYWSTGKRFVEFFCYSDPLTQATTHDLFPQSVPIDGEACAVEIEATPNCIFVSTSPLITNPCCSGCGQIIEGEPVKLINAWWQDGNLEAQLQFTWTCNACGTTHKIWELDWAEVTGFHRYAITINNYYLFGDTIDDTLWIVLREASGADWHPTWTRI